MNPALHFVGAAVLLPLASASLAGEVLDCTFTQECVGSDRPCNSADKLTMSFVQSNSGWMINTSEGEAMSFTPLPGKSEGRRSFLSQETDPEAHAVSMLSIFSDGQAFMSTHGVFLSPGTVTHIGTCLPESK